MRRFLVLVCAAFTAGGFQLRVWCAPPRLRAASVLLSGGVQDSDSIATGGERAAGVPGMRSRRPATCAKPAGAKTKGAPVRSCDGAAAALPDTRRRRARDAGRCGGPSVSGDRCAAELPARRRRRARAAHGGAAWAAGCVCILGAIDDRGAPRPRERRAPGPTRVRHGTQPRPAQHARASVEDEARMPRRHGQAKRRTNQAAEAE
eukprot:scaffold120555_cov43-Phaeocystis_antarctica.AAC.1